MDVKEAMTRKVAGMPLYLWVLGVGGGLAVAYYLRSHSTATDVAGDAMDGYTYDAITDGTGGAAVSDPGYYGTGGGSGYTTTEPVEDVADDYDGLDYTDYPTEPGTVATGMGGGNNAWRRAAIASLIGMGVKGTQAQKTVDAYMAGTVNRRQKRNIDKVLAQVGAPPKAGGKLTVKSRQRDDRKPQQQPRQDKPVKPFSQVRPNVQPHDRDKAAGPRRDTGGSFHQVSNTRAPQGRATARKAQVAAPVRVVAAKPAPAAPKRKVRR